MGACCPRGAAGSRYRKLDEIVPPTFEDARDFYEGLAQIKVKGSWGYLNLHGLIENVPDYAHVDRFSEGVAAVEARSVLRAYTGFINHSGETVIGARFVECNRFRGGRCLVTTDDQIGYINQAGENIWSGPIVEADVGVGFRP